MKDGDFQAEKPWEEGREEKTQLRGGGQPRVPRHLTGGDFEEGQTSNLELDDILGRYLPAKLLLPCDTLPTMSHRDAEHITARVAREGLLYFPLYIAKHWIAGLLTFADGKVQLKVIDSAPSRYVHKDLRHQLDDFWPNIKIKLGKSARQVRGSQECGLFMLMHFFAHYLKVKVRNEHLVPARLRGFMASVRRNPLPRELFFKRLREIFLGDILEGGGPKHQTGRSEQVSRLLSAAARHERETSARNLCYLLTATVLVNAAQGKELALNANALSKRQTLMGFKPNTPHDVAEALEQFYVKNKLHVLPYGRATEGGRGELLVPLDESLPYTFVQTDRVLRLPAKLGQRVFVLGAKFSAAPEAGSVGHYTPTTHHQDAVVGLYMTAVTPTRLGPESTKRATKTTVLDAADEEYQALLKQPQTRLKARSGHPVGPPRPSTWFVFKEKFPHVLPLAWAAVTDGVRKQQRRWVQEIKSMPHALQQMPLPTGIATLLTTLAAKRGWASSTLATTFTTVRGALLNLPLYTNESQGIDLALDPGWRAAAKAAARLAREREARAPPYLTYEDYENGRSTLRNTDPEAYMFLTLMWQCAARPKEISELRAHNVSLKALKDNAFPVAFSIRQGKGTRFRGPYKIPTALEQEDGDLLRRLLSRRRSGEKVFLTSVPRMKVRATIRLANRSYGLASIRKGAVRYLADHGMPTEQLMRITGHTSVATLHRYLGYGLHLLQEDVITQANAAKILRGQTCSA